MPGALVYIRVSTEEQQRRNVANLPTQEKKAREHGSRLGLPVLKVFSDEESGRTPPPARAYRSYSTTAESTEAECRTS